MRRFHLGCGLLLALGCRGAEQPSSVRLELAPASADVWTSRLEIRGRASGAFTPSRCEVTVDRDVRSLATTRDGFSGELTLTPGPHRVSASCWNEQGRTATTEAVTYTMRQRGVTVARPAAEPPRLEHAVVYGVLPPLYGDPPLKSVTAALPSLSSLGVTTLWLSPIAATPPGDFGYAVVDYFTVRSDYGTDDDLRELVRRAHELGLEVLLDFVPNHTSAQHPYFVQAQELGERSHYFGFYDRDAAGNPTHYFDWEHLPNLNYGHPEVVEWMTAAADHWLREYDVDGFRVDAAWGVARRSPSFYPEFARDLEQVKPGKALLAEASARDPFYLEHGFDAAYDWTEELGRWAWAGAFEPESGIPARLVAALEQTARAAPRVDRVLRFLNNNDTGARFVTRHGVGLTRAATVLLLTWPGVPCLYSFDEVGGEFEPYAGLRPIEKKSHPELLPLHRDLIRLRRALPALTSSGVRVVESSDPDVLAYVRHAGAAEPSVLVAINFSAQRRELRLPPPAELGSAAGPATLRDLVAPERRVAWANPLRLSLEPYGYALLATAGGGAEARGRN